MKRSIVVLAIAATLGVGTGGVANADPTNPPTDQNPNACVGTSSTTANVIYQQEDPDKLRSDQARADGQPGRADAVNVIPQCIDAGRDPGRHE